MKRSKLVAVQNIIDEVLNVSKKVKLNDYLIQNKDKILAVNKRLVKLIKMDDKFTEFNNKRTKLCEEYCEKDKKGKPIIDIIDETRSTYRGLENHEEFEAKLDVLKKEYEAPIKERDQQIEEVNEFLDEDTEIEFIDIPISLIPDDLMSGKQQEILKDLITMEDD